MLSSSIPLAERVRPGPASDERSPRRALVSFQAAAAIGCERQESEHQTSMSPQNLIEAALNQTIDQIPESPARRRVSGKVRDVFWLPGERLALVTTDRISVFGYVIGTGPVKGQVLNQLAGCWRRTLDDIGIPHHLLSLPHPNVSVVRRAAPLPIEIVVRGYLTGSTKTSSWYAYQNLDRVISGITMPKGM